MNQGLNSEKLTLFTLVALSFIAIIQVATPSSSVIHYGGNYCYCSLTRFELVATHRRQTPSGPPLATVIPWLSLHFSVIINEFVLVLHLFGSFGRRISIFISWVLFPLPYAHFPYNTWPLPPPRFRCWFLSNWEDYFQNHAPSFLFLWDCIMKSIFPL